MKTGILLSSIIALTLSSGAAMAASVTASYKATSAVGSGNDHSIWISTGLGAGIGKDFDFDPAGAFTLYDDGTAKLKGQIVSQDNAAAGFDLVFNYDNEFDWGNPIFKSENGSAATAETFYRNLTDGTLTGTGVLAGLNLSVSRKPADGPYATQIGPSDGNNIGANNKNKNFGMATWFTITLLESDCGAICNGNSTIANLNGKQGDVNIDLEPVPVPATGLLLVGGLAALSGLRRRKRPTG